MGEMDFSAKRLLLFAPDVSIWNTIRSSWENTVIRSVNEATGLNDVSYKTMLEFIRNSIA